MTAKEASSVRGGRNLAPPTSAAEAKKRAIGRLRDHFEVRWGTAIRDRDNFTCQRPGCGRGWFTSSDRIFVYHKERFADLVARAAQRNGLDPNRLEDWPRIEAAVKLDRRMSDPETSRSASAATTCSRKAASTSELSAMADSGA
jgi:hypothetical protein